MSSHSEKSSVTINTGEVTDDKSKLDKSIDTPLATSPAKVDKNEDNEEDTMKKKKKPRPRILREYYHGIWTVQELEGANPLVEWYKGLRASLPSMGRLIKSYWDLSPLTSFILIVAHLIKAFFPSLQLWLRKEFLDQVQLAVDGKPINHEWLMELVIFRLAERTIKLALALITYSTFLPSVLMNSDKCDSIMERKLGRIFEKQLVESYLKLEADQISSLKVTKQFEKVMLPCWKNC